MSIYYILKYCYSLHLSKLHKALLLILANISIQKSCCSVECNSSQSVCIYIHTLQTHSAFHHFLGIKPCSMSMGRGKMMVEFFSAAMELRLCRYRSWSAEGDSAITREASFRAREAFISPSAVMIWNTDRPSLFVLSVAPHQPPHFCFLCIRWS